MTGHGRERDLGYLAPRTGCPRDDTRPTTCTDEARPVRQESVDARPEEPNPT